MSARQIGCAVALAVSLVAVPRGVAAQNATEVVIEWNRILQETLLIPGAQPPTIFFSRPYAILQVAVFDALNSIDFQYTPYAIRADAVPGASREVAAAQAARDVMVAMYPAQSATFDAALAATVGRVGAQAAADGARVGAAAARAILDLRRDDGWNRTPPPYILPDLAGYWQPVPPQNAPAAVTHYPDVRPFVLASGRQFLAEPPPPLTSQLYANDFNEVKRLGGVNSTERTADQTLVARLWAAVGYSTSATAIWFNLGRDLARARGMDGLQTARLFALLGLTQHDALLTSFTGKFIYGLWRPVTAVREAARDGNAATEADTGYLALLATPPYPAYPGNMACIGGSLSTISARFFGRDDIAFTTTWTGVGQANVTRSYTSFRQLSDEEARSRIYGGIHYQFDSTASVGVCTQVAEYAFANYLRARF